MDGQAVVGRVKGPGERPHTFLFVAPDQEQVLKIGEFITYPGGGDTDNQIIVARVIARRPLRLYPDSFLSNPTLDPRYVAETVGYAGKTNELFELTAEIVGCYDKNMRTFLNPRVTPRAGTAIFVAPDNYLSTVLSRVKAQEAGGATVGWLSSRQKDAVPVTIDIDAIASTHLAIIASTGAGKSYTASVLIEEMLAANNRAAILVIDPHGEYNTLDHVAQVRALQGADGYRPTAAIRKPGAIKIRVGTLTQSDLRYLLPNVSERMDYLLGRAFIRAQDISRDRSGRFSDRWTMAEFIEAVKRIGAGNEDDGDDKYKGTADALQWRLESVLRTGADRVFDDQEQTRLTDILRPGLCTVMQLSQIDAKEQQVIVATLLRRIYQARVQTVRQQVDHDDDYFLPYPVFVLIEEAHNFAPAGATMVSTGVLKQILAEGRKFGVGVGLISQRPGKLDPDVLSQCNTQFLLRIVNPVDQARVAESVESIGRDLLSELPALNKGQAIISGVAINTPVICQIRMRHTPHGGESASAAEEWLQYSSNTARSDRDNALSITPSTQEKSLFRR